VRAAKEKDMGHPLTLPAVTALALAGAGLGVYLGKSAVAQIDPVYFSSPAPGSRFHADLVPARPDWDSWPAQPAQDAFAAEGLGTGCVGCRTYPEEYFPAHDSAVDAAYAVFDGDDAGAAIEGADREIAQMERRMEQAGIERYAHYPIASDEKPVAAGRASADPEPAKDAPDCAVETQCEGEPTPGI
jgi:hypothetical protein